MIKEQFNEKTIEERASILCKALNEGKLLLGENQKCEKVGDGYHFEDDICEFDFMDAQEFIESMLGASFTDDCDWNSEAFEKALKEF
jgi:hypothetical protein